MALLALFLPVVLLGALLGLERVEAWTTPARASRPERQPHRGRPERSDAGTRAGSAPVPSRPAPEAAAAHAA